ncbi:replication-associated protein [Odonata-associated circular virus-1]|uniref:replication-associated protein n=1 Tax=Odonata-associated circular virus-1 TaxID=1592109 RepID=UPI00058645FB|nr:replication-associated protein [Odonata-associated circular virus-1]AJD07477.1 replication-associated protein [Odonata-associated circular virus-1]
MSAEQPKPSDKASHWLLTLNNPTADDRERCKNLPKWVKRFKFQDEIGESGTLHIQGYIHTETVRLSALKKWFPRGHFEVCRNPKAAENYAGKEETSVPGTQHDFKNTVEQVTMMDNLIRLCDIQPKIIDHLIRQNAVSTDAKQVLTGKQLYQEEYWGCVNVILEENPDLISTYTMPQYCKAWVNCRPAILNAHRVRQYENERTAGQPDKNEIITPEDLTTNECLICSKEKCECEA